MGLLGMVSLASLAINSINMKNTTATQAYHQADHFRKKIVNTLQDDRAWQNTINDTSNTSLNCLRNNTNCTGASGTFRVRDAANNIVYNPLTAANGFNMQGVLCSTFSAAGNNQCPFR